MNKIVIILVVLFLYTSSFGQTANDKIMFVVDSIPVIDDPEEGNDILQTDISDIIVIKNKDSLKRLGYERFDGLTFLFTKGFRSRPDSIKQIPSSKQMQRKDKIFLLHDIPYSGQFIDYYYSGRKQGEGTFLNGKVNGLRRIYFQSGKLNVQKVYKDGLENGQDNEYYEGGLLKQKGEFLNGKEEGIWEDYFPNGQVKLRSSYKNGDVTDSAFKYYSTGKIKERVFIKNGKVIPDPNLIKISQLMTRSNISNKEGNIKAAIKFCSKVIDLDTTYASAYFSRGTIKLNDLQFDEAIEDFDRALKFEPFMEIALSNRAFARIRKYELGNSRTLLKNNAVTVLASKEKVPILENEQEKICSDLQKAVELGDKSKMVTDALLTYCQKKSSR